MEEKNFGAQVEEILDTPDTTNNFDPVDAEENKVMAILAYLGFLVLVPIFAAKNSKFARFHANQGLVLFIAEIAASIVLSVVTGIAAAIIPVAGLIFNLLGWAVEILTLLFAVVGIVNAATGKAKELPIIGSIQILK